MVIINGQYRNQREYLEDLEESVRFLTQQFEGTELIVASLVHMLGGEVTLTKQMILEADQLDVQVYEQKDPEGIKIVVKKNS